LSLEKVMHCGGDGDYVVRGHVFGPRADVRRLRSGGGHYCNHGSERLRFRPRGPGVIADGRKTSKLAREIDGEPRAAECEEKGEENVRGGLHG
jgi:hypothetical protein